MIGAKHEGWRSLLVNQTTDVSLHFVVRPCQRLGHLPSWAVTQLSATSNPSTSGLIDGVKGINQPRENVSPPKTSACPMCDIRATRLEVEHTARQWQRQAVAKCAAPVAVQAVAGSTHKLLDLASIYCARRTAATAMAATERSQMSTPDKASERSAKLTQHCHGLASSSWSRVVLIFLPAPSPFNLSILERSSMIPESWSHVMQPVKSPAHPHRT